MIMLKPEEMMNLKSILYLNLFYEIKQMYFLIFLQTINTLQNIYIVKDLNKKKKFFLYFFYQNNIMNHQEKNQKKPLSSSSLHNSEIWILWIDDNCQSNYNGKIVDFMREQHINHALYRTTEESLPFLFNSKFTANNSILVICTNNNCQKVASLLAAHNNILEFVIFCGTQSYGDNNVRKLGGKFKKAVIKADDLISYILKFNQTICALHQQSKLKKQNKSKAGSKPEEQPIGISKLKNQYSSSKIPAEEIIPNENKNSCSNDVEIQKKLTFLEKTYKFIGETYITIGGQFNQSYGKGILKNLS